MLYVAVVLMLYVAVVLVMYVAVVLMLYVEDSDGIVHCHRYGHSAERHEQRKLNTEQL